MLGKNNDLSFYSPKPGYQAYFYKCNTSKLVCEGPPYISQ